MRDLTDKGPQYKAHSSQCFFKKQTKVMCLFYYFILGCTGSLLWCAWLRLSCPEACGLLAPQPGIELIPFALELPGLNHWTAREDPICHFYVSSVQFSRSVVSDSLRPHESQHARPPCPSPTPGVHSDSLPSSQ